MLTTPDPNRHRLLGTVAGVQAWGEDQDAWPINRWSAFRRITMGAGL